MINKKQWIVGWVAEIIALVVLFGGLAMTKNTGASSKTVPLLASSVFCIIGAILMWNSRDKKK